MMVILNDLYEDINDQDVLQAIVDSVYCGDMPYITHPGVYFFRIVPQGQREDLSRYTRANIQAELLAL